MPRELLTTMAHVTWNWIISAREITNVEATNETPRRDGDSIVASKKSNLASSLAWI